MYFTSQIFIFLGSEYGLEFMGKGLNKDVGEHCSAHKGREWRSLKINNNKIYKTHKYHITREEATIRYLLQIETCFHYLLEQQCTNKISLDINILRYVMRKSRSEHVTLIFIE